MSDPLFMIPVRDGKPTTLSRSLVTEICGPYAKTHNGRFVSLEYPGEYCALNDGTGVDNDGPGEDMEHLGFLHFGGERTMEAIWQIADRSDSIICWVDDPLGLAVTRAEILNDAPAEFRDGPGLVHIVSSAKELVGAIWGPQSPDET